MLASSAFLQHKVSRGCIFLHTDIWSWWLGELSLTASLAPGKADGSTEVCLPQTLEWSGNFRCSLKGALFFLWVFLRAYITPLSVQQWKAAHTGFFWQNTSNVTSQKTKSNSSHWKLCFSKLEVLKTEQQLKQILILYELNIVDLFFMSNSLLSILSCESLLIFNSFHDFECNYWSQLLSKCHQQNCG